MTARDRFHRAAVRQRLKRHRGGERMNYGRSRERRDQPCVPDGFISVKEAAIGFHKSESGIFRAIAKGHLESQKIGRFRVIEVESLKAYFGSVNIRRSKSNTEYWRERKEAGA